VTFTEQRSLKKTYRGGGGGEGGLGGARANRKAFYEMLSSAQKLLHEKATFSQLDAIGCLMGLKSQYNMSRACFDGMLAIIGGLLLEGHILPSSFYES
jgi:hypothetical protein